MISEYGLQPLGLCVTSDISQIQGGIEKIVNFLYDNHLKKRNMANKKDYTVSVANEEIK